MAGKSIPQRLAGPAVTLVLSVLFLILPAIAAIRHAAGTIAFQRFHHGAAATATAPDACVATAGDEPEDGVATAAADEECGGPPLPSPGPIAECAVLRADSRSRFSRCRSRFISAAVW